MDTRQNLWKVAVIATGALAAMAARNAASATWRTSTGGDPPTNPADPGTSWGEALGWTMVTGAIAGVARMAANRGAAEAWRAVEGVYPPGIGEDADLQGEDLDPDLWNESA